MSSERRISARYAKGLMAQDQGNMTLARARLESLKVVQELFQQKDAGKILLNPVMPPALKRDLLNYALRQGGADEPLTSLVLSMVDAGRVAMIPELVAAYTALIDGFEGILRGDVTSAVTLSSTDLAAIGAQLSRILKKRVDVAASVDASLLGGFVARVGNFRIDMSLKTKLDTLAKSAAQDSLV